MKLGRARSTARQTNPNLHSRRLQLRPLVPGDFTEWQEVRRRNRDWLEKWEPTRPVGGPDVVGNRHAFTARCNARERERHLGTGFGFGVFDGNALCGEMNLSSVQRGPFQNCYVGYWIDEAVAGRGYTPEALVTVLCFAFEELGLHRVQIAIIPRNEASLHVVQKLEIRNEGMALRYLEINGEWEDHVRFAITTEEWSTRQSELSATWL